MRVPKMMKQSQETTREQGVIDHLNPDFFEHSPEI
jgi:hypothetical protein